MSSTTTRVAVEWNLYLVCVWPAVCTLLTQRRVLGEALHTHGLSGHHGDDGGVARLEGLGVVLQLLAGATVDLLLELAELAGDVGGVAVQHGGVALGDGTGVVQDDDLQGGQGVEPTVRENSRAF